MTRARLRVRELLRAAAPLLMVFSLVSTAAAQSGNSAQDEDVQEAVDRFRRGVSLFEEQSYEAALVEFLRAYEIAPNYRVLYNIALVHGKLHRYVESYETFQAYLRDSGDALDRERQQQVQVELERLRDRIAEIVVRTNVDGATITVDDETVGQAPLGDAILVSVGRHRVVVTAPGYMTSTEVLQIAGGEHRQIQVDLAEQEIAREVIIREQAVQPESSANVPLITSIVATGVLATATVIVGILTIGANGTLDDELARFPSDPSAVQSARDDLDSLSLITDVLGGATIAATLATVILLVTDGDSEDEEDEATGEASLDEVDVRLRLSPMGGGAARKLLEAKNRCLGNKNPPFPKSAAWIVANGRRRQKPTTP